MKRPAPPILTPPCQLFAARSIIGVALRPLKLTDPERTESTKWTESVEGHEAKRSAQAQLCLRTADWPCLAALPARSATLPASPGRYLAKKTAIADRVPERTESTKWTESVEAYGAKRSALLLPKTGRVLLRRRAVRRRGGTRRRLGHLGQILRVRRQDRTER